MTNTNSRVETLTEYPDAERIGPHLVIDKTEWVPGPHPDPHRRHTGQAQYLEQYLRCLLCGVETINEQSLPDVCGGEAP